jgi:hypothetical protein
MTSACGSETSDFIKEADKLHYVLRYIDFQIQKICFRYKTVSSYIRQTDSLFCITRTQISRDRPVVYIQSYIKSVEQLVYLLGKSGSRSERARGQLRGRGRGSN